jgi:putative addiction module component (TIGR02574 family)
MATTDDLLSDALQLPLKERARLAHELLLSLEESAGPDADADWAEELKRRADEVISGKVQTRDAREVLDEVNALLREPPGR